MRGCECRSNQISHATVEATFRPLADMTTGPKSKIQEQPYRPWDQPMAFQALKRSAL